MFAELEDVKKLLQKKIDEYGEDLISSTEEGEHDVHSRLLQPPNLRGLDESMTSRANSLFVEVGDIEDRRSNEYLSEIEN